MCSFGGWKAGKVRILVHEPRQVAVVRRFWWHRISQQLRSQCPRRAVAELVFENGSGGIGFGSGSL
jgi:hypothetical protein